MRRNSRRPSLTDLIAHPHAVDDICEAGRRWLHAAGHDCNALISEFTYGLPHAGALIAGQIEVGIVNHEHAGPVQKAQPDTEEYLFGSGQ